MIRSTPAQFLSVAVLFFVTAVVVPSQSAKPHSLVLSLQCPQGDCPLLKGVPQTIGMRSGLVRLEPGATVGWHTTGMNEESLVILHGQGNALIDGGAVQTFTAPAFVYIPPATRHNVANTGNDPLEYVYVVAPAKQQQ